MIVDLQVELARQRRVEPGCRCYDSGTESCPLVLSPLDRCGVARLIGLFGSLHRRSVAIGGFLQHSSNIRGLIALIGIRQSGVSWTAT
ncbi:hypothetical protein DdX_21866 [Ditylenchus destructor]|uniref:Uncharacterized protein n=1 Tax=Ditylenchus destructor TaxID=166010 RepID=A0AAD4MID9_9BILA|nr:hypothetical protein DdX_21866 [Ditylenchus destructor]